MKFCFPQRFWQACLGAGSAAILATVMTPGTVYSQTVKSQPTLPTTAQPNESTTPATTQPTTVDSTAPAETPDATAATSEVSSPLATHVVLVLSERRVYAYRDSEVLASYPVAIGKKGWETPKGNFEIIQMVENPIWENPWNGKRVPSSLNGPIGIRWIGFWSDGKNTIGFHGTPKKHEHLLGKAVSHGCVRMRNPDVVALYEIVEPGIPVSVVQTR